MTDFQFLFLAFLNIAQADNVDFKYSPADQHEFGFDLNGQENGDALADLDEDFSFDDLEEEIKQDEEIQEAPQHALGYYVLTPA